MKLTDAEIDEIVTQPCSATGRRKKELAIEVKELRAANTRLQGELADAAAERRGRMPLKEELAKADAENTRQAEELRELREARHDDARAFDVLKEQLDAALAANTRLSQERDDLRAELSREQARHDAKLKGALREYEEQVARNTPLIARVAALEKLLGEGKALHDWLERKRDHLSSIGDAAGACVCAEALEDDFMRHIELRAAPAVTGTTSDKAPICKPGDVRVRRLAEHLLAIGSADAGELQRYLVGRGQWDAHREAVADADAILAETR